MSAYSIPRLLGVNTRERGRAGPTDSADTKAGTTDESPRTTVLPTPCHIHHPPMRSGAAMAPTMAATAAGWRQLKLSPATRTPIPSAAAAPATINPKPRMTVAGPGQVGRGSVSEGGRTFTNVCTMPVASPAKAKSHARMAMGRDTRRTSPPMASARMPTVNHTGVAPGPPG